MVFGVAFTPDGKRIASCSQDKTVRLWNAKSGKSLWVYKGHMDGVSAVCVSPDGTRLVSCGGYDDRNVKVWDATVCDQDKLRRKAIKQQKRLEIRAKRAQTGVASTVGSRSEGGSVVAESVVIPPEVGDGYIFTLGHNGPEDKPPKTQVRTNSSRFHFSISTNSLTWYV